MRLSEEKKLREEKLIKNWHDHDVAELAELLQVTTSTISRYAVKLRTEGHDLPDKRKKAVK